MTTELPIVITEIEAIESLKDLKAKYQYIMDFCRENAIVLWTGDIVHTSMEYTLAKFEKPCSLDMEDTANITAKEEWDLFLSRLKKFNPSFVFVEMVNVASSVADTKPWCLYNHPSLGFSEERIDELRLELTEIWIKFARKHITFTAYLFYAESKVCIQYTYKSSLYLTLRDYERTEEDYLIEDKKEQIRQEKKDLEAELQYEREVQEEEEEENREQLEYEKQQQEHEEFIAPYIKELSQEKKLLLTKNSDQRYAVTRDFFGKRFNKIEAYAEQIAKRAMDIFEFDVLPTLVKNLKEEQKTVKQISDELGISLAKAKKIYAIV